MIKEGKKRVKGHKQAGIKTQERPVEKEGMNICSPKSKHT